MAVGSLFIYLKNVKKFHVAIQQEGRICLSSMRPKPPRILSLMAKQMVSHQKLCIFQSTKDLLLIGPLKRKVSHLEGRICATTRFSLF